MARNKNSNSDADVMDKQAVVAVIDSNNGPTDEELVRIAQAFEAAIAEEVDETEEAMAAFAEDADVKEESHDAEIMAQLNDLLAAGAERDSKSGRIRQLNRMGVPSARIAKLLNCRYQQVFVTLKRAGLDNIRVNVKRGEVDVEDFMDDEGEE